MALTLVHYVVCIKCFTKDIYQKDAYFIYLVKASFKRNGHKFIYCTYYLQF